MQPDRVTVLNAHDTEEQRYAVTRTLRDAGFFVKEAGSGAEALRLAQNNSDVILLDVHLPDISGLEVCRKLRSDPRTATIPIIQISATFVEPQHRVRGLENGADAYITQPFNPDELVATINAMLRVRRAEQQRDQLLEKFERQARILDAVLASSSDHMYVCGPDCRFRYVNAAGASALELSPSDMIGKTWRELGMSPTPTAQLEKELRRVLRTGECITGECEYPTAQGNRSFEYVLTPVGCEGGVDAVLMTARDVTERKRAQQALIRSEKLAGVGRMAATIAHEINNPLAAVVNSVYLALHDPTLPDDIRDHLQIAERQLQRVTHITKQTLGFYRERAASSNMHVRTMVDELLDLFGAKLQSQQIHVNRRYSHTKHISLHAVPGEIRQALSNLVGNAIDAMGKRGGTLHLRVSEVPLGERRALRITVADTGSGIRPEHKNDIFEPFFTTKEKVGTGLGLWVTRELVSRNGGSIRMRSRVGDGTVFCLFFQLASRDTQNTDAMAAAGD